MMPFQIVEDISKSTFSLNYNLVSKFEMMPIPMCIMCLCCGLQEVRVSPIESSLYTIVIMSYFFQRFAAGGLLCLKIHLVKSDWLM